MKQFLIAFITFFIGCILSNIIFKNKQLDYFYIILLGCLLGLILNLALRFIFPKIK
ncbi:hypothetical protein SAMN05443292_2182 [Halpernia frigidisoli]|uniref:Lipoprotein n=1 Tax=Halpernia frigidisoli TaxID=1125876 RepID=A0A1I3H4C4_9FLAO|nr:hypothetical protein SAMN05443292_2182 [Halpernia frigidisoli]